MKRYLGYGTVAAVCFACAASFVASTVADDPLSIRATWRQPTAAEVKAQLDAYLADLQADDAARAGIDHLWSEIPNEATGPELLDRLAASFAAVDPRARELADFVAREEDPVILPTFEILEDETAPAFVRDNLRLLLARRFLTRSRFDELAGLLENVQPDQVVDPATLLFCRGGAYHWLLKKEESLGDLETLLQNADTIPRRYRVTAELMIADIKPLKTDSLDEVARLMRDIERRLDFGRAGKRVRDQQDDVIAKLDKMIEELEKQRQQQQQSASGGSMNPSSPMQDSSPGGAQGEGKVDPKKIGAGDGWGNLPPKEREDALQKIGKDFPSHYREVIEEYFRKLARDGVER